MNIEPILLTTVRVQTYQGGRHLTNATGFFFERDERLFLVSSLHVFIDPANAHHPDRLKSSCISAKSICPIHLFLDSAVREWFEHLANLQRQCGDVDVAVVEINRAALPGDTVYRAFSPAHLPQPEAAIEVGDSLLVVGFPLGFQDCLHHLPVVRQAVIASSFGLRFQGQVTS
jgi:hypothetical protein